MTLKKRVELFFDKIQRYIDDTPNRRERKFQKRMLGAERRLEALQLQTDIELEKSEIAKQRNGRELIKLKVRKEREKLRPKRDLEIPMPLSMAQERKRKKPLPIGLRLQ